VSRYAESVGTDARDARLYLRLRRRSVGGLSLVICAGLIWAPGALAGHSDNYSGTYAQSNPQGPAPELDFTVGKGKRNGKLVPKTLRAFRTKGLGMHCPSGQTFYASDGGANGFSHGPGGSIKKNRKFSFHLPEDVTGDAWTVTGKIPRSGPAAGTVRESTTIPEEGGLCDSGVVTWTATKG